MISYQYSTSRDTLFDATILKQYYSDLSKHSDSLARRDVGFLTIHEQDTASIHNFVQAKKVHYDFICILGIGGSMLGPQFLYDSLGKYNRHGKTFVFVDNIDSDQIQVVRRSLPLQRTLFLVQSKSGQTPETIALYAYFMQEVMKQGLTVEEHFVFVTDPNKGYLREESNKKAIPAFDLNPNIGGRFSVLTPIGLLTAAFADIDIDLLLVGSKKVIEGQFETITDASAFSYAAILDFYYRNGISLNVIMPYSSKLRLFSNWAVQLISESTGKEHDRDGNKINWGITPVPALGATDQHSQLQLFSEGPNNKLITFIEITKGIDIAIEETPVISETQEYRYLKNKSFRKLMDAEFKATRQSLEEKGIPTVTISLDGVNEFSMGMLIQFFQLTIGYLGEITNVDMFNQPGVERSKLLAKQNMNSY